MKFRFPILAKIAILGTLTSVVAAGISVAVSYANQVRLSEKNLMSSIDNTLDSIKYSYTESDDAEGNRAQLATVVEKAASYYADPEVQEAKLSDFDSFTEYETFMKGKAVWFYPPTGAMIGSLPYLEFRNAYMLLQSSIVINEYSAAAVSCFVAYFDEDTASYVFAVDSRAGRVKENEFYHLAASHYTIKESDDFVKSTDGSYDTYLLNGHETKLVPITNNEGAEIATFFIEYSTANIEATNLRMLWSDLAILFSTSIAIIGIIVLASYLMFTRNIVKLTKSAESVSAKLASGEEFKSEEINIRSNDEIKTLSNAFVEMEHKIENYVDIIKKEAADKEKVAAELSVASKIQLEALPAISYDDAKVGLEAYIAPAKEVGGDFYDYFYLGNKFVIIISDVSGKGVPAALFMMRGKELVKAKLNSGLNLTQAMKEANDALCQNNTENLFITCFVGIIDFEKGKITYVNAGHERPYILSNGEVVKLDGISNFVLGGMDGLDYVSETAKFKQGDRIFLFTDGLNESINKKEEEFGYGRIESSLSSSKDLSLKEVVAHMENDLKGFVGSMEPFDDTTMMIVENKGVGFYLHYKKKDYSIIEDAVNAFDKHFKSLPEATKEKVGIIFDELLNNLVSYEKREDLEIKITAKIDLDQLIIIISGNGENYDILKMHKDKLATDNDGLEPGGFGITIVKDLAKEVTYGYKNGWTFVTVVLDIDN